MKLIFVWLINNIIILPFKIINAIIKVIYHIIKNIYFNNFDLEYINNLDGYQFESYTYAIQCKRYNKPVGIKAIQEAISGCTYYNCDIPVVFTNNTFSKAAINLAKNNEVELWDHETLCYFLKKSKLLTKSLPFYYPLISLLITLLLFYGTIKKESFLIPLLISLFFFISIIIKIIKDKTKASLKTKPKYLIHDYHDTID